MKRRTFKYFVSIIITYVLISNCNFLIAQNSETNHSADANDFSVVWLKQLSSIEDLESKSSILQSVKDFIFGKSNITLQKPVNLIALDTNSIIALDQGIKFPVIINIDKQRIEFYQQKSSYPSLLGICKWENNTILFTDSKLNKIYSLSIEDDTPKALFDSLILNQPTGIDYNSTTKEIWITETGMHQVKVLDNNGNIKRVIGKRGNKKEEFNFPTYLWIDSNGLVYIVDALNFRIQIYNSSSQFVNMFGETGDSPGYFSSIKGIATDSFGHIYIVDALFNVIQVFDKEGNFLYNFGGLGKDNGQLYFPSGIYIDSRNFIYVADTFNSRIQIFKLIRGN